jgi:hypothetical protein
MTRNFVLLLSVIYCSAHAQVIQDPLRYHEEVGRTYLKWVLDINHDGLDDILISLKKTPDEIKESKAEDGTVFNPNYHGFGVYIGRKSGGYVNSKYVIESIGEVTGEIGIDISRCYVGYIDEVKRYGIVTVEETEITAASGKGLPVPKKQVYCYTIEGDHIKRTDLTPLFGIDARNPVYDKYLSDSKRRKVQLEEVRP